MIVLVNADACVLIGKNSNILESFIDSLKCSDENLDFTDEGSMDRYLDIDIQKLKNNKYILRQQFLIKQIQAMDIDIKEMNKRSIPVVGPPITKDTDGLDRKGNWHYLSLVCLDTFKLVPIWTF